MCFSTGNFSSALKIANVIPVFKKNDHTLCNNYHPILLLSNISKIIVKPIHVRQTTFLNASNIFYKKQFGFRHNHLATHTLFDIIWNQGNS